VKTIAIVINSSWAAYAFRLKLAQELKKHNYKVVFFAPDDGKYANKIKKHFDYFHIEIEANKASFYKDIKYLLSLYILFKNVSVDVALTYSIKPNIYVNFISSILKFKTINNITGLGTVFINKSIITTIVESMYKFSLRFSSHVFFQNKDDYEFFQKKRILSGGGTSIIPGSGVNTKKFKSSNKRLPDNLNIRFIFLGRLLKEKGVVEFLNAAKFLTDKYDNLFFSLLGELDPKNRSSISRRFLSKYTNKNIVYLGMSDSVESVIDGYDCVVLPSYREGLPRSLLEASSMSIPIITTNAVGCRDVIIDRVNGFVCKIKDVSSLIRAMENLINLSIEDRISMGREGRTLVLKKFEESIVINEYLKIINKLLKYEKIG